MFSFTPNSNRAPSLPVGGRGDGFFFSDPRFFIFDIAKQLLKAERVGQLLLTLLQGLLFNVEWEGGIDKMT